MKADSLRLRKKIAREAAHLLYSGVEKEYKQAKLKAAKAYGSHFLPTNLEVVTEIDKIAEENEASTRRGHLIQMRTEALKLMQILRAYNPLLIGSVWRGTVHYDSDVDVTVYHDEPEEILKILGQSNLKIVQTEWVTVTKKGKKRGSFHVYAELPAGEKAEIKVVPSSEVSKRERCEIYGDKITGLTLWQLEKLLKENPTQRFLPS